MKKTVLLLLATLIMACIGAGCAEEEHDRYYIRGDKLVCNKGCCAIKYSPRDLKDIPAFLYNEKAEASASFMGWYQCFIWTGILDGERYYALHTSIMSELYGRIYSETGEALQPYDNFGWTDIEVIYIHPKYIEYCKKDKGNIGIIVPGH